MEITASTAIAEKKKVEVEGVKNAAEAKAAKIGREKDEVQPSSDPSLFLF